VSDNVRPGIESDGQAGAARWSAVTLRDRRGGRRGSSLSCPGRFL